MTSNFLQKIAEYFCVSDIPGATIPSTSLSKILESMYLGQPLSSVSLKYLAGKDLLDLHRFATAQINYEEFVAAAQSAKQTRERVAVEKQRAAEAARSAREAEWEAENGRRLEAAKAAREALENDPKYIAKMKSRALRAKYGMHFIDQRAYPRLMAILEKVDSGRRMAEDDYIWLTTVAQEHFTAALESAFHQLEAEFFAEKFKRTGDPWNAVNASGHYRRCGQSEDALELLDAIGAHPVKHPKLQSAVCTTRGGAMRDLGRLDEARQLGEEGHEYRPGDFRPCTLLGAVHMELGNFDDARTWYAKGEVRGATQKSIDSELKRIFQRADKVKRDAIRAFLLREDPQRFAWVLARKQ
ncbi:hypothetical protein [Variovorax rhizosphaerae]|uniref:Tetratricopeptide repeat protein n=1 Tax=Variovorax rhizosphaerae TaxID=1836200 RepID=A0ABU8WSD9_9BURK